MSDSYEPYEYSRDQLGSRNLWLTQISWMNSNSSYQQSAVAVQQPTVPQGLSSRQIVDLVTQETGAERTIFASNNPYRFSSLSPQPTQATSAPGPFVAPQAAPLGGNLSLADLVENNASSWEITPREAYGEGSPDHDVAALLRAVNRRLVDWNKNDSRKTGIWDTGGGFMEIAHVWNGDAF